MEHKKFSKETVEKMQSLYEENLSAKEISKRLKISYSTVYVYAKVFSGEFGSRNDYWEYLAKQKGFESLSDYRGYLAKQRQEKKDYKRLSIVLQENLKERGRQSWLANQVNITRQAVSLYLQGKAIPNEKLLRNIFHALNLPYKTLEDLLENETVKN